MAAVVLRVKNTKADSRGCHYAELREGNGQARHALNKQLRLSQHARNK